MSLLFFGISVMCVWIGFFFPQETENFRQIALIAAVWAIFYTIKK